jgi:predicted amidophosphoribosyltransferase
MKCPQCGQDNPSSLKFCGECGARLVALCPACGAHNSLSQKFCGECGERLLQARAEAKRSDPHRRGGLEAPA